MNKEQLALKDFNKELDILLDISQGHVSFSLNHIEDLHNQLLIVNSSWERLEKGVVRR